MLCTVTEFICSKGHLTPYEGGEDNIFFVSGVSGIAEEMFWDFHGWFNYGKLSFTKYCQQITLLYQTTNPKSAPFVSNKTFIQFFFSWIVRMGIDFRQEIDPFCRYDPEVLACDGTHVGVSLKHQRLDDPVTRPELEDEKPTPLHQKAHRCFLPHPHYDKEKHESQANFDFICKSINDSKDFLYLLCCRALKDEELFDLVADEIEEDKSKQLLLDVLTDYLPGVKTFVAKFMQKELPPTVMVSAAKLFRLMLKQDAALSAIFPVRFHTHLKDCLDAIEASNSISGPELEKVKEYGMEIAELLETSVASNSPSDVIVFIRELVQSVQTLHDNDRVAPPPKPIPGTYNPPSGTAYYFTEHGQKLREMPNYVVNDKEQLKTKRAGPCTKIYPKVSTGGFGYMFLFFCPYHGHCYGFHLVEGGEGRKDPFAALFKYKPTPPKEVFYDFACQFNEYCLNREPAFFKFMRVWHDLFHGFNHTCAPVFKSTRVQGLDGLNSEICEQFNAYLQSIKFTGSHLSQTNFMLFSQFMIYLWNREKTERVGNMARVARNGLL